MVWLMHDYGDIFSFLVWSSQVGVHDVLPAARRGWLLAHRSMRCCLSTSLFLSLASLMPSCSCSVGPCSSYPIWRVASVRWCLTCLVIRNLGRSGCTVLKCATWWFFGTNIPYTTTHKLLLVFKIYTKRNKIKIFFTQ